MSRYYTYQKGYNDKDINGTSEVVMVDASDEPDNAEGKDGGALKKEEVDRTRMSLYKNVINIRAGRFLGILVVPQYWNQTIRVSFKFQRNDIINFSIIVVLPSLETVFQARKLVIAILLKTKAWYLQTK